MTVSCGKNAWQRLMIAVLTAFSPTSSPADGAGPRETRAFQACLLDHPGAWQRCRNVAYYICMADQLERAANPILARERCLHQELAAWTGRLDDACAALGPFAHAEGGPEHRICAGDSAPETGAETGSPATPEDATMARLKILRQSADRARMRAIHAARLLAERGAAR